MKRTIIFILCAAILCAALASCSGGGRGEKETTSAAQSESVDTAATETESVDTDESEETWIEKNEDTSLENWLFDGDVLVITKISSDCFYATTAIPFPYEIKLNGELSEDWSVGDHFKCEADNVYYDIGSDRVEADLIGISRARFESDPEVCYKPVIYLYPRETTNVSVGLDLDGELLCAYPAYEDGWSVTASPDGTLTDRDGKEYNYLYWEGEVDLGCEIEDGFCVRGEDTARFLESALAELGLTRREANEFIVFWLPLMEDNAYNVISFDTTSYEKAAKLDISPSPDTLIRVFMSWYPAAEYVSLEPQTLVSPERVGFTAVEWGGAKVGAPIG